VHFTIKSNKTLTKFNPLEEGFSIHKKKHQQQRKTEINF